jgi:hypothetical protein
LIDETFLHWQALHVLFEQIGSLIMSRMEKRNIRMRYLAAGILISSRYCSCYISVPVLTLPRTRCRYLSGSYLQTARRRRRDEAKAEAEFGDSIVLFAVGLEDEKEKIFNETVSASTYFANRIYHPSEENDDVRISKPLLNGVSPKQSLDRNGIKAATTTERNNHSERNFPSLPTFEDNESEDRRYKMVFVPAEKLVKKNGVHKTESKLFFRPLEIKMDSPELQKDETEVLGDESGKKDDQSQFPSLEFLGPMKDLYIASLQKIQERTTEPKEPIEILEDPENTESPQEGLSIRRLWRRRHARTLEEGIRRKKSIKLSDLLTRAQIDARKPEGKGLVERTLMGLFHALAEEVEDLDVEFSAVSKTPLWRKEVKELRINFSRLGFKPIRMGGSDKYDLTGAEVKKEKTDLGLSFVDSADEAFDRIDKDNSGTLDRGEIAQALSTISDLETDKKSIEELAADLVDLYDANSDGVVDRDEYKQMVEDMATIRPQSEEKQLDGPLKKVKESMQSISKGISEKAAQVAAVATGSASPKVDADEREMGSIVLSDLNLDLRRLIFGGFPIIKRVSSRMNARR